LRRSRIKKKLEYKEEETEAIVDHPELEQLEKEERQLNFTRHIKFAWGFIKSLIIIILCFAIFMIGFYYWAKSRAGV